MNKTAVSVNPFLTPRIAPRTLRRIRPLAFFAAFLLALLSLASAARAADKVKGRILSVGIGGTLGNIDEPEEGKRPAIAGRVGTYRPGTWVPVLVELTNVSGEPRKVRLSASADDLDNDTLNSIGPTVTLPDANPITAWFYYWPSPSDTGTGITTVAIRGDDDATRNEIVGTATIPYLGPNSKLEANKDIHALFPADSRFSSPDGYTSAWRNVVVLGSGEQGWGYFRGARGGNASVSVTNIKNSTDLPASAIGLDGVDIVVWNTNEVHVSQLAPDFQRKALIEWVRAGGHLILIAGPAWQELAELDTTEAPGHPGEKADLLPAIPEAYKPLPKPDSLKPYFTPPYFSGFVADPPANMLPSPVLTLPKGEILSVKATPKIDSGAHVINARDVAFNNAEPIAYVRPYGAGFVTLVTVNVGDAAFQGGPANAIASTHWVAFWCRIAGFNGAMASSYEMTKVNGNNSYSVASPGLSNAGLDIPGLLDVASVTQSRLLFAVLFLVIYWVVAGPGGHAVLRAYKKVYWSWWVFGFVVIVAAFVATAAAYFLRVTDEKVRHHSYIVATANSSEATVTAYYGVLTPSSHNVSLQLPAATGESYITPLYPFTRDSSGFSPRTYETDNDNPGKIDVPFRRTLKRVQAQWTGNLDRPLITGSLNRVALKAGEVPDQRKVYVVGTIVNNSGVILRNVSIVFAGPKGDDVEDDVVGSSKIVYYADSWPPGERLTLDDNAGTPGATAAVFMDKLPPALFQISRKNEAETNRIGRDRQESTGNWDRFDRIYEDQVLLQLFADATDSTDPIISSANTGSFVHVNRPYSRGLDRTNVLRTLGAVLIAQIGSDNEEGSEPAFLNLSIDDHPSTAQGKTIFAVGIRVIAPPKPVVVPPTRPATATKPATVPATRN